MPIARFAISTKSSFKGFPPFRKCIYINPHRKKPSKGFFLIGGLLYTTKKLCSHQQTLLKANWLELVHVIYSLLL